VSKYRVIVLVAALFTTTGVGSLAAELQWSVETGFGAGLGRAAYDLDYQVGSDTVLSRLEFPLDGIEIAVRGLCSLRDEDVERWLFEAGAVVALSDPVGLMRDYDWIEPAGYPKVPFSYTESNVESFSFGINLKAARPVFARGYLLLYLYTGYRFGYLDQVVQGYKGWQYKFIAAPSTFDLSVDSSSADVIQYTLYVHALPVGVGVGLEPWARIRLSAELAGVVVYAADRDDHLLRYKLSTASGLGLGLEGKVEARWCFSPRNVRRSPYLSLAADGRIWQVSTTQTQEWYGDDPSGTGDETGTVVTGVGHTMTEAELRATLSFGLEL